MSKQETKSNDTAFPSASMSNYDETNPVGGLTKREYFANNAPIKELIGMYHDRICATVEEAAALAVDYADALIKALNEKEG